MAVRPKYPYKHVENQSVARTLSTLATLKIAKIIVSPDKQTREQVMEPFPVRGSVTMGRGTPEVLIKVIFFKNFRSNFIFELYLIPLFC